MTLTTRQHDILQSIESGIKFLLKEHPERKAFKVFEVTAAAGYEKNASKIYSTIQTLKKAGRMKELKNLRDLFHSIGIVLAPLEDLDFDSKQADEEMPFELDSNPENNKVVFDTTTHHHSKDRTFIVPSDPNPLHDSEYVYVIIQMLQTLGRSSRERIMESVQTYFGSY